MDTERWDSSIQSKFNPIVPSFISRSISPYFSPNKIDLSNYHNHQQLKFFGYTESFLFENVEDKLKIINDAFELLESLTKVKINTMIQNMINYERVWNRACLQKSFLISEFDIKKWNEL